MVCWLITCLRVCAPVHVVDVLPPTYENTFGLIISDVSDF
jgi:hypothetical protein